MIRIVFQTLSFILFVFQFQQSVRKYFQYPVVEQTSRIPVKDLSNPVVYVCQKNQFMNRKAQNNGYKFFSNFLTGITENSTTISWRGKWGNSTFKDLENLLLVSDYSSL